ncbi:MAG: secondary thiamine-phosphate synthase enzyme YjbQ [Ignavibacteria bacterium]
MKIINETIFLQTKGHNDIIDITDRVSELVENANIKNGTCVLFSVGSTAGITTIEYEPGLLKDLPQLLNKLVPAGIPYHHDDTWGDGNGYAHLRSSLIKTSFTIPIVNGELTLGRWQQVIFIDFDNRRRERKIIVQITGE